VIAKATSSVFKELSATNATTAQLREVFTEAENVLKLTGRKTLLFIDEIQVRCVLRHHACASIDTPR
jgi:putative ATPase